jgi:hypothetical protein
MFCELPPVAGHGARTLELGHVPDLVQQQQQHTRKCAHHQHVL